MTSLSTVLSTFTVCFNPLRFSLTLEPSFIAAVTLLTCTAEETFPAPALSFPVETPADAAIKLKSSFAVTSVDSFALIVAFSTMALTLLFEKSAVCGDYCCCIYKIICRFCINRYIFFRTNIRSIFN